MGNARQQENFTPLDAASQTNATLDRKSNSLYVTPTMHTCCLLSVSLDMLSLSHIWRSPHLLLGKNKQLDAHHYRWIVVSLVCGLCGCEQVSTSNFLKGKF